MIATRPLRASATLLALALLARAPETRAQATPGPEVELRRSALPDAGGWIAEPGRAGWMPGHTLGLGWPRPLAGLVRGAWRFEDAVRAPDGRPFPGMTAVLPPLTGHDSLAIEPGGAPGGVLPERALATVRPVPDPAQARGRPRAIFGLVNGDFGEDETSLTAERGAERSHIHLEVFNARRGIHGPYGEAGRHRWSLGLGSRAGAHEVSGTFRQAGYAARLLAGEEQTSRGSSGRVAWGMTRGVWTAGVAASRQWDSKESFGGTLNPYSRRDAQDVRGEGFVRRQLGTLALGLRGDWSRAEIRRSGATEWKVQNGNEWGAAWLEDRTPRRLLALELGVGRVGATGEVALAPLARMEGTVGAEQVELWAGRLLEPVWGDVGAGGERGFLQSTWAAGAGWKHAGAALETRARVMAGRTRDRALVARLPLEELWLRAGYGRDPDPWEFVESWGLARWKRGWLTLGAEAAHLLRDEEAPQARVDPALTGQAYAEAGFTAFRRDLEVRLRLEGDGVGERATDEAAPRTLDAYVNAGAAGSITIGDATVTLRVRNLENRRRPEVWIDPATGAPALGTPREMRVAVIWKFRN